MNIDYEFLIVDFKVCKLKNRQFKNIQKKEKKLKKMRYLYCKKKSKKK